jgi:hypothetical protein
VTDNLRGTLPSSTCQFKTVQRMAVETYTIYPTNKYNRPNPPSTIALHGLDLLSAPIQIQHHGFFHRPPSTTSDVIDNLKSSLAEALELYPPVTGTVQAHENGEVYIVMDAENILGTPFLVEMKDARYAGDTEDLSPRTDVVLPPSSSIFAVKVTQVKCSLLLNTLLTATQPQGFFCQCSFPAEP